MQIIANNITKTYLLNADSVQKITFLNTLTNTAIQLDNPTEFIINFKLGIFKRPFALRSNDMKIVATAKNSITFSFKNEQFDVQVTLTNSVVNGYISTAITSLKSSADLFIDSIAYLPFEIDNSKYNWHCPYVAEKSFIEPYFMSLGQPIYYIDMFFGIESMTADNAIDSNTTRMKYYIGRTINALGSAYLYPSYVVGGGQNSDYIACQNAFFKYVETFARPAKYRLQFNSWYDNMLDITPENIDSSFRAIQAGFSANGLDNVACYVVDDGWVDYKKSELWAFNAKFPNEFNKESALTRELNSTFGVWFGPRGGYSEAFQYAKKLKKIGYHVNKNGYEICTADNKYVSDLADKMIEFIDKFNVTYFKIDGFAIAPCKGKNHGHPVGGYKDMYFYCYQWECWLQAFAKIRAHKDDIFLNVTSHSNTSPWLLKQADAVWLNNSKDMNYIGGGSDLHQCANYRDDRYYDFTVTRQLQFPLSHIYNHEPCYGNRNYNPPLPAKSHRTVCFTDEEFEQYLYMSTMRGSGFVELYYSPNMMTENKHAINARILKWAEANFNILKTVKFFGTTPKTDAIYGYIGYNNGKGILSIRNASTTNGTYNLNIADYVPNLKALTPTTIYGDISKISTNGSNIIATLDPQDFIIISF
ncbi:MAG: hypothetical protein R3Y23_06430 [Bacillota bacterium]